MIYLQGNSTTYFTKFPKYEYGFNQNANFHIDINNSLNPIIFGLATSKEIKNIHKKQNDQKFCDGSHQLSEIQSYVYSFSTINGIIKSKEILTPYIFTCDKQYFIEILLSYNNGDNNLDYRCQSIGYYIVCGFFLASFLITLFCISNSSDNYEIYYMLIEFILLVGFSYIFFQKYNKYEYFDILFGTTKSHLIIIYDIIFSIIFIGSSIIFVRFIKIDYKNNLCDSFQLAAIIINTIFVYIAGPILTNFMTNQYVSISIILFSVMFLLVNIVLLSEHLSFGCFGFFIYYLVSFLDCLFARILIIKQNNTSIENLIMIISNISGIMLVISSSLILYHIKKENNVHDPNYLNTQPLLQQQ